MKSISIGKKKPWQRRYKHKKCKRDKLYEVLWEHANWDNTGDNEAAKNALETFLALLKKTKPQDFYYLEGTVFYMDYIHYLYPARKALQEKLYQRACNRIVSLLHCCCSYPAKHKNKLYISQRIHANLLHLLEEGLLP